MRCQIAEDEEHATALGKLRAALEEHILDAEERRFVEPRLAQLLGLGEHEARDRQDLFAAWRVFFERLAETYPTVLAFEDMQWADASLLDFVEHLLEWSRNHPLFVVTLARPELAERRPTWGAGHRNFTSLYLEPLAPAAMEELLAGLVPGPAGGIARPDPRPRRRRAAVCDGNGADAARPRRCSSQEGSVYQVAGEIESLEVPETLHALIAARLDGLSADERRLLGDAAVLGKTFTPHGAGRADRIGRGCARPAARRARAQGGARAAIRSTLPRARPVRVPAGSAPPGRLRDAAEARAPRETPQGRRSSARDDGRGRGRRGRRLPPPRGLPARARRPRRGAPPGEGAGCARPGGRTRVVTRRLDGGPALLRAGRSSCPATRRCRRRPLLAQARWLCGSWRSSGPSRCSNGRSRFASRPETRTPPHGSRAGSRSPNRWPGGSSRRSSEWRAPTRSLPGTLRMRTSPCCSTGSVRRSGLPVAPNRRPSGSSKPSTSRSRCSCRRCSCAAGWSRRASSRRVDPEEARGLYRLALDTILEHELPILAGSMYANLSDLGFQRDRYSDSLSQLELLIEHSRRTGNRRNELFALSETSYALTMLGRWQEALARLVEIPEEVIGRSATLSSPLSGVLDIYLHRGELDQARRLLARYDELGRSSDVQEESAYYGAVAAVRLAEGNPADALTAAEQAFEAHRSIGIAAQDVKLGFVRALEAALALGNSSKADELLTIVEQLPVGLRPPLLDAATHRFRARLAGDDPSADVAYATATAQLSSARASVPSRRRPARARRMARRPRPKRGRGAVPGRGAGDVRAARGQALAGTARRPRGRRAGRGSRLAAVEMPRASRYDHRSPMDQGKIRNFSIIAHIDHGKSTLADRILEVTDTVTEREMREQLLDSMELERERGITIKAQAVRVHVEGPRAEPDRHARATSTSRTRCRARLAACEGAVLVVDAAQGIEAQTLANAYLAIENDLEIVPVLNKIDLPQADPDGGGARGRRARRRRRPTTSCASRRRPATGVADVLDAIVERIPAPRGRARRAAAGADLRLLVRPVPRRGRVRARRRRRRSGRGEALRAMALGTEFDARGARRSCRRR